MNYLAHLFLSGANEDIMLGNFLADMLSKKETLALPLTWHKGVEIHRKIDWYTDNHQAVKNSMGLLYEDHHKYSPVLVDIFYDYVLHQNWEQFSEQSPTQFRQRCYTILMDHWAQMPAKVQPKVQAMVQGDWLRTYTTLEGIDYSLNRLKKRVSRPQYFEGAVDNLAKKYTELENDFLQFFPDILLELAPIIEKNK